MRPFIIFVLGAVLYTPLVARPLTFERRAENSFWARLGNEALVFHDDSVTMGAVTLRFANALPGARLEGVGASSPATYFYARTSRTFAQFPKLALRQVYPGVDAIFYGNGDHLEYDLVAAPGADLARVRILFDGARRVRLDARGDLRIETGSGELMQKLPRVFDGAGNRVTARYRVAANQVGFRIGRHSERLGLTIDPELVFTKYFGGSGTDQSSGIATDGQGNIYITGVSNSVDFPVTAANPRVPKAPLVSIASGGATTPLPVSTETTILAVGGNPDGSVLYAIAPDASYVSSDHGATWTQNAGLPTAAMSGGFQYSPVNNIAVDTVDPSRLFVATSGGLYFSSQGGQSWYAYSGLPTAGNGQVNASEVLLSPADRALIYVVVGGGQSGLYKSTNYGSTFTPLIPNYPNKPQTPAFGQYVMALSADGGKLYVVDPYGTLLSSTDEGVTWQVLPPSLFGASQLLVDPANSSNLYVADFKGIEASSDGGMTFRTLATMLSAPGIRHLALDAGGTTLYFVNFNGVNAIPVAGGTPSLVPAVTPNPRSMAALGGQVYVGYDSPSVPYVIKWDPSGTNVLYSTFFGGSGYDIVFGMAVDAQGNCTVAGQTTSPDFPVTAKFSGQPGMALGTGFAMRLSADGTQMIYSTLLGGSAANSSTAIRGVALDSAGAAYVTGQSTAKDFPVSANAFQAARPQAMCTRPNTIFSLTDTGVNGFAAKISPDGSKLAYSTLVTGSCGSFGSAIAVDGSGQAVVAGFTTSNDFPALSGAYQSSFPGDPSQIAPPNPLSVGFAVKLSAAGDQLIAGTFLGGSFTTTVNAVTLDARGNTYLTGSTARILPGATPGAYQGSTTDRCAIPISIGPSPPYGGTNDAFVLKLDAGLATAGYLTYLGGGCDDSGSGIALDAAGNAWVSGPTVSPDFPLRTPFQGMGSATRFVSEISADGSQLLFSSLTDGTALAIDPAGGVQLSGVGTSPNVAKRVQVFGGTATAVEWQKINPAMAPVVTIDNVQPVTNFPPAVLTPGYVNSGLVPGQLVQIKGHNLGPAVQANGQFDATGRMPFTLAGTTVLFDNIPAPLVSVSDTVVVCFAPFEIAQMSNVTVVANGQRTNTVRLGVGTQSPQILSVMNADGTVNSTDHPAKVGDEIVLYVSGMGETRPLSVDGLMNTAPLPVPVMPVMVEFPRTSVRPDFIGAAPGQTAGIVQINARVPAGNYPSNSIFVGVLAASAPLFLAQ